jgi:hypothetical protein
MRPNRGVVRRGANPWAALGEVLGVRIKDIRVKDSAD